MSSWHRCPHCAAFHSVPVNDRSCPTCVTADYLSRLSRWQRLLLGLRLLRGSLLSSFHANGRYFNDRQTDGRHTYDRQPNHAQSNAGAANGRIHLHAPKHASMNTVPTATAAHQSSHIPKE